MRLSIFIFILFCNKSFYSQNNIRLFSADGSPFKVLIKDKIANSNSQANVVLEKIKEDTLTLKIEFDTKQRYTITLYLFDKGVRTIHKEFNYRIEIDKNKIKVNYMGTYEIISLPSPLVPNKPSTDSTLKNNSKK